jgi:uncharacterized protein YjbI with pentapeptide repeats
LVTCKSVYNCTETTDLTSKLCILHDPDYLLNDDKQQSHKKNVLKKLEDKLTRETFGKKVECTGYFIPEMKFSRILYLQPDSLASKRKVDFYFNHVTFLGEADFNGVTFSGDANFSKTNFSVANFNKSKFSGKADFIDATFSGRATFYKTQFSVVNFNTATFSGEADFTDATFSGEADFNTATFSRKVNLFGVRFSGKANFGATFSEANFNNSKFSGEANFNNSKFSGEANFIDSTFSGEANFNKTIFSEKVYFINVIFLGDANFYDTTFLGEADFTYTIFSKFLNFNKIHLGNFTKFRNVIFESPQKIFFYTDTLTNLSFLYTDITRVNFSENSFFGKDKSEDKIIEERELELTFGKDKQENSIDKNNDILKNISLESIIAVYRSLRENYEYNLRYSKAGQFFIREMELQRKYRGIESKKLEKKNNEKIEPKEFNIKENNWLEQNFSLTGLYFWLSKYGQDLVRPFLFTIGILFFATLFWMGQPNAFTPDPSIINFTGFQEIAKGNDTHAIKSFERSFSSFIPIVSPGLNLGVEKTGLVDIIITSSGLLAFGLLIISMRRKFERRFRH